MKRLLRAKILIVTCTVVLAALAIIMSAKKPPPLELVNTSPANGSVINVGQKELKLSFSEELDPKLVPEVQLIPSAGYEPVIEGKDLVLRLSETLNDQTTYNLIVENVRSKAGAILNIASLSFSVNDTTQAGKFKRGLPHNAELFSLWHVKDNEFYVIVRSRDFNKVKAEVEILFRQAGLNPTDYTINYDTNTSASEGGEPSFIEQQLLEEEVEEGDESSAN